jgi:hypothetical protein
MQLSRIHVLKTPTRSTMLFTHFNLLESPPLLVILHALIRYIGSIYFSKMKS